MKSRELNGSIREWFFFIFIYPVMSKPCVWREGKREKDTDIDKSENRAFLCISLSLFFFYFLFFILLKFFFLFFFCFGASLKDVFLCCTDHSALYTKIHQFFINSLPPPYYSHFFILKLFTTKNILLKNIQIKHPFIHNFLKSK